jgi:hypothetical protein
VPEHDDIVVLAVEVPYMVGFSLETEAFKQRDSRLLIDTRMRSSRGYPAAGSQLITTSTRRATQPSVLQRQQP